MYDAPYHSYLFFDNKLLIFLKINCRKNIMCNSCSLCLFYLDKTDTLSNPSESTFFSLVEKVAFFPLTTISKLVDFSYHGFLGHQARSSSLQHQTCQVYFDTASTHLRTVESLEYRCFLHQSSLLNNKHSEY